MIVPELRWCELYRLRGSVLRFAMKEEIEARMSKLGTERFAC